MNTLILSKKPSLLNIYLLEANENLRFKTKHTFISLFAKNLELPHSLVFCVYAMCCCTYHAITQ